jgi:hypothetical protein
MQKRNRGYFNDQPADSVSVRAVEKPTWIKGTISFWDDERGKGYVLPERASDLSGYERGWYFFCYTGFKERTYSPRVGDVVLFRTKLIGSAAVAEIMEVLPDAKA